MCFDVWEVNCKEKYARKNGMEWIGWMNGWMDGWHKSAQMSPLRDFP